MYLHTAVLLPVCIGNLWGFTMPAQINSLFADYLMVMVIEAYYRCDETALLQLIKRSTPVRTLFFMSMSAVILNTQRCLQTEVMWFIQAFRKPKSVGARPGAGQPASVPSPLFDRLLRAPRHVCSHSGSCDAYVLQGMQYNLKVGLIIELVRFVMTDLMRVRRSPLLVLGVFSRMRVRVISFFIGYTTIYRVSLLVLLGMG